MLARILARRFAFTLPQLTALFALYLVALCNTAFWSKAWQAIAGTPGSKLPLFAGMAVLLIAGFQLILTLLCWPRWAKGLLMVLALLASITAYFTASYGVMIDSAMLRNVFQTDTREALELLNLKLVLDVLLLGVLPAWLISRVELQPVRWPRLLLGKLGQLVLCLVLMVAVIGVFYSALASFTRNHKPIRYLINPANGIYATIRYVVGERMKAPVVAEPYGRDAKKIAPTQPHKPTLLVLVVGETARAENFSLNGYARPTNPELAKLPIINFSQVSSCGTETAVSVPCMFSGFPRSDFSVNKGEARENLIDILRTAGLKVVWIDNNSGSKGVAKRLGEVTIPDGGPAPDCRADECYDTAMLPQLQQALQGAAQDTVVVLHQKGNHGPAYWLRYPAEFEVFKPVCRTTQLQDCPREQILNAYDNAIRFTDHFLAQLIGQLQQRSDYDSAMLYVSDHGESTGENGLYLHAAPYMIAPSQQTHVPMVAWFSPSYAASRQLDLQCLQGERSKAFSHDNWFHTVLGAMGVSTSVYQPPLDMLASCRK
ncbi:phosphoethanolamine transferase [Chitinibacter tainanensis]|uniref:phosphoethanolamine transferase n=1 Tax=Chitinibacter tainanensis TaxID=230667 RepID=UPI00040F5220|nr:phosphoethanolamine--lipid A transferase [Chitinibacter tainanensis]